ncbi:hypothetical protein FVE85_7128 [Porphyridium purpureum]|uniref:Uncharacterized protein n=1 Tax=Porphyridium purpureum TaxID=35688 RepID=A0A5J4Z9W8_PORPP|nr:hypothetical protein FVE85_7128 [Porphyridium purpureum]|eukprot:POR9086..scf295_1
MDSFKESDFGNRVSQEARDESHVAAKAKSLSSHSREDIMSEKNEDVGREARASGRTEGSGHGRPDANYVDMDPIAELDELIEQALRDSGAGQSSRMEPSESTSVMIGELDRFVNAESDWPEYRISDAESVPNEYTPLLLKSMWDDLKNDSLRNCEIEEKALSVGLELKMLLGLKQVRNDEVDAEARARRLNGSIAGSDDEDMQEKLELEGQMMYDLLSRMDSVRSKRLWSSLSGKELSAVLQELLSNLKHIQASALESTLATDKIYRDPTRAANVISRIGFETTQGLFCTYMKSLDPHWPGVESRERSRINLIASETLEFLAQHGNPREMYGQLLQIVCSLNPAGIGVRTVSYSSTLFYVLLQRLSQERSFVSFVRELFDEVDRFLVSDSRHHFHEEDIQASMSSQHALDLVEKWLDICSLCARVYERGGSDRKSRLKDPKLVDLRELLTAAVMLCCSLLYERFMYARVAFWASQTEKEQQQLPREHRSSGRESQKVLNSFSAFVGTRERMRKERLCLTTAVDLLVQIDWRDWVHIFTEASLRGVFLPLCPEEKELCRVARAELGERVENNSSPKLPSLCTWKFSVVSRTIYCMMYLRSVSEAETSIMHTREIAFKLMDPFSAFRLLLPVCISLLPGNEASVSGFGNEAGLEIMETLAVINGSLQLSLREFEDVWYAGYLYAEPVSIRSLVKLLGKLASSASVSGGQPLRERAWKMMLYCIGLFRPGEERVVLLTSILSHDALLEVNICALLISRLKDEACTLELVPSHDVTEYERVWRRVLYAVLPRFLVPHKTVVAMLDTTLVSANLILFMCLRDDARSDLRKFEEDETLKAARAERYRFLRAFAGIGINMLHALSRAMERDAAHCDQSRKLSKDAASQKHWCQEHSRTLRELNAVILTMKTLERATKCNCYLSELRAFEKPEQSATREEK